MNKIVVSEPNEIVLSKPRVKYQLVDWKKIRYKKLTFCSCPPKIFEDLILNGFKVSVFQSRNWSKKFKDTFVAKLTRYHQLRAEQTIGNISIQYISIRLSKEEIEELCLTPIESAHKKEKIARLANKMSCDNGTIERHSQLDKLRKRPWVLHGITKESWMVYVKAIEKR